MDQHKEYIAYQRMVEAVSMTMDNIVTIMDICVQQIKILTKLV